MRSTPPQQELQGSQSYDNATTELKLPQNEQFEDPSDLTRAWSLWTKVYEKYRIILLLVANICLARAYPQLGAEYLYPQITAAWIAVFFIFRKLVSLLHFELSNTYRLT